ncbi:MAG TPA: hypothetical protein VID94_06265 [Acidimicrobiales bacterium]
MQRTAVRWLVLGALLVLLAAACGDDGGGGDAESFAEPTNTDDGAAAASTTTVQDTTADTVDDTGDQTACDLLTTEAVAELIGQPVVDGEDTPVDGATACLWDTEANSQVADGPITMSVELGAITQEIHDEIQAELDDPANQPLDIGDAAVHVCGVGADGSSCASLDLVVVAVGDQYLEVDLGNWGYPGDFEEGEGQAITEEAARQATAALG